MEIILIGLLIGLFIWLHIRIKKLENFKANDLRVEKKENGDILVFYKETVIYNG